MQSQRLASSQSIYISTSEVSLEFARLVGTQLEGEGYTIWIDDHQMDFDWPNIQNVVDDSLKFVDAGVLVVIDGGDPNKIEAAHKSRKPVLFLNSGDPLRNLLAALSGDSHITDSLAAAEYDPEDRLPYDPEYNPEYKAEDSPEYKPRKRISPKAAAPVKRSEMDDMLVSARVRRGLLLLMSVVLNVPTLIGIISMYPLRTPSVGDWLQLLIIPTILATISWAFSDRQSEASRSLMMRKAAAKDAAR